VISFPVFFLYARKAEVKTESRLECEVVTIGVEDIMSCENDGIAGDGKVQGWIIDKQTPVLCH
jgi:hypothetical protein